MQGELAAEQTEGLFALLDGYDAYDLLVLTIPPGPAAPPPGAEGRLRHTPQPPAGWIWLHDRLNFEHTENIVIPGNKRPPEKSKLYSPKEVHA